jgi:hypothetical protein
VYDDRGRLSFQNLSRSATANINLQYLHAVGYSPSGRARIHCACRSLVDMASEASVEPSDQAFRIGTCMNECSWSGWCHQTGLNVELGEVDSDLTSSLTAKHFL